MSVPSVLGFDVTGSNLVHAPAPDSGLQAALYVTGSGGVAASAAQLAQYPKCLRIAQWPVISVDESAVPDYFDLENGAITTADLTTLVPNAIATFTKGSRPGQRWPAVYCGDNTSPTAVANTLNAAGLGGAGVGLVLVNWSLSQSEAEALLSYPATSSNPYPVVGVQFADTGPNGEPYDQDVYASGWVDKVSVNPTTTTTQSGWKYCSKCQGLFWGPELGKSVCPAGGNHDDAQSSTYTLTMTEVS